MNITTSVTEILKNHVTLEVERIDRMYLNLYVPQLQRELGVVGFIKYHLDQPVPSTVVVAETSKQFVRGQRKDDVARQHLACFQGDEGVLFVGRAQEKAPVFRAERRRRADTGAPYPWIVSSTAMVNHFYCVDADIGLFFLKFCTCFPYNAKLCLNGHEYAKRLHIVIFYTRTHARILCSGLAVTLGDVPAAPIRRAFVRLERTLDEHCQRAKLAA